MKELGFIRVGALVNKLTLANPKENAKEIIKMINVAEKSGISIIATPELALTGCTVGDLFLQDKLIKESLEALKEILDKTKKLDIISIIGMPIKKENKLFNSAVVINKGEILGIVPKTCIPNYSEQYEKRWFSSSKDLKEKEITILGKIVPMTTDIIFEDKNNKEISFAIEINQDLWSTLPPSLNHTLNGAKIIFNLSSDSESVGKYEYRKNLISMQAAKTVSAYIYASSGAFESTSDVLFSGYATINERGTILKENQRFTLESNIIYSDIDIQKLSNDRQKNISHIDTINDNKYIKVTIDIKDKIDKLERIYEEYPFVPSDITKRNQRCEEIINIQATALARRLLHLNINKTVIGISGGLDSTLAFLVMIKAYEKLKLDPKGIIAITMPGFGTTNRTYQNALSLIKEYGVTLKEIDIKESCTIHLKDIGLSLKDRSITYENAQARERTQILMDVANMENALVIGTGDLSELALGWCTYNGDHMSMYGVNASIPKTLVRHLVKWIADTTTNKNKKETIYDILDTPISPELLPPDKQGNIKQKTESSIGPYVLHDFFLYHFLRYGSSPKKIYILAQNTFKDNFSKEEIKKWLEVFIKRFFQSQFKRNCVPDGIKVGTISLSPRGDLKMPSDANYQIWLDEIKSLE